MTPGSPARQGSPLRDRRDDGISPTRVDSIAKLKDYLGENPFRYTYQVAPNRLLILEEVTPNTASGAKSTEPIVLLREDYPYEWNGTRSAAAQ